MDDNHSDKPSQKEDYGFLVLTRRLGEGFEMNIDGTIVRVYLNAIIGNMARFGIEAPKSVRVNRFIKTAKAYPERFSGRRDYVRARDGRKDDAGNK